MTADKKWMTYEEVATYLLDQFAQEFGIEKVEGKEKLTGKSGTEWEIDAKGYNADGSALIIVECKRHTKAGVSQAIVGSLAATMQELNATGGILISPNGLQAGAKVYAQYKKIIEVKLDQNSTTQEYIFQFLKQIHIGLTDNVKLSDYGFIELHKSDGTIIKSSF